jgi:O-antigen ligase
VGIAAIGLLAGLLRLSEWRVRFDLLSTSLALYFLVLLASSVVAVFYSGPLIAAASFTRVLLFGVSIYVFFYTAHGPASGTRPAPRVSTLFWIGVGSALFACLDFYFQFPAPAGFGPQFVWLSSGVFRRAQGVFYEASTLGNLCAFFLAMIATALLRPRSERPIPRYALIGGGAAFCAALIFSYSRASVLNVFAAVAALIFLHRKNLRLWRVAALPVAAVVALVVVGLVSPTFSEAYWSGLGRTAQYFLPATEMVLSGRLGTWRILERSLTEEPWHAIVGVGYKSLPYSNVLGEPLIVDNMYLSALAETGVIGLAALLLLNFAILRAALRAAKHADPRRSFFGAWIFSFWLGQCLQMLSGDLLTYWRVLPVYFWALALAVRAPNENPVP